MLLDFRLGFENFWPLKTFGPDVVTVNTVGFEEILGKTWPSISSGLRKRNGFSLSTGLSIFAEQRSWQLKNKSNNSSFIFKKNCRSE